MLLHTQGRFALAVVTIVAGWGFADVAAAGPGDQKFSIDFGVSFPNPDHDVMQSGTTSAQDSGSDGSTVASLGLDYRIRLDHLFYGYGGGNGAAPNGQIEPAFTPRGPVAGLWGRVFLGGDDQNRVDFDFHNNPIGIDTHSYYSRDFFVLPYVGYEFALGEVGGRPADLTVFGGPRIEQRKIKFKTDEAGNLSSFSDTETDLGFTVGFDIDFALWALFGNVGNVGNVGNTNSQPFFRIGAALDYNPAISLRGRSSFPFDYEDKIESSWEPRLFVGVGLRF
jgi:hypothetical protein